MGGSVAKGVWWGEIGIGRAGKLDGETRRDENERSRELTRIVYIGTPNCLCRLRRKVIDDSTNV